MFEHQAIPATPALASLNNADTIAPAIAENQAVGAAQVDEANLEYITRKRLRLHNTADDAVTVAELGASKRRKMAVEMLSAQAEFGIGNAGIAAAINTLQATGTALQATVTDLTATVTANHNTLTATVTALAATVTAHEATVTANHNTLTAAVNTLTASVGYLTAETVRVKNNEKRARNLANVGMVPQIEHLQVEMNGPNPIGSTPPGQPVSRGAIHTMTAAGIHALEASFNLANEHFGGNEQVPPVPVHARRNAVEAFYTLPAI